MNFKNIEDQFKNLQSNILLSKPYKTTLVGRGHNSSTIYLKIPKKLRSRLKPTSKVYVKRISYKKKIILIFEIMKIKTR